MSNIPDSAIGFIFQNLKDLIQYHADLFGGVEDEVGELCNGLDALKAVIRDSTERYSGNEIVEILTNEIRNVVYRAEDAIEKYIHCALHKIRGKVGKLLNAANDAKDLKDIAEEIKKVNIGMKGICQTQAWLIQNVAMTVNVVWRREETHVIEEENVVGFEDATKDVIELLTGEDQSGDLEVISIIGMLGLGKTTLAKKVFNHPNIQYKFYTRAFVNLSHEYERRDSKEVFLEILGSFMEVSEDMNRMSNEQLAEKLKEQLMCRKYLIVLDDVWTTAAWDDLKTAFPDNKKHSRVLITSRHTHVATHVNENINPYNLRFLNRKESKELLRRKVFGIDSCPSELEEYEVHILNKCDGLPLAIVVIAGILVNAGDKIDLWKKVAEDVNNYYGRNLEHHIDDVINLSYNHMPYFLRPCFLYLGVFPEDFDIPVWKLIRLWIAEGFIERNENINLEDIAGGYVEELVDRNLVMVGKRRSTGQVKTCRIHDTLRDFCKEKAKKENLFHEIKRLADITDFSGSSSVNTFRRLCVHALVFDYIKSKPSADYIRSFLSFSEEETTLPREHATCIPRAFKLLRVLESRSILFPLFPIDLLKLVLLQYVAISGYLPVLPEKMSNLLNLQTLIVETQSRTLEIKFDIWKLTRLRHVQTNVSTCLQSPEEKSSVNPNLQTLSKTSPESCSMEIFTRAPKLRKLGICGKLANATERSGQSNLFTFLVRLEDLENLKLLNDDAKFKLFGLPQENNFPGQLRKLTLMKTLLEWRHMSTLGKLEKLEVLKLKDHAFQGVVWETQEGGFRSLKVLHIGTTNLARWKAGATHFPKLRSLFLRHCSALEAVPSALGDVPTLQEIDLYCTNTDVAASARKIQLLKLSVQAQDKKSGGAAFKFCVYPPD